MFLLHQVHRYHGKKIIPFFFNQDYMETQMTDLLMIRTNLSDLCSIAMILQFLCLLFIVKYLGLCSMLLWALLLYVTVTKVDDIVSFDLVES